jgi:PAS domain S-box-containing protein
VLAVLLPAIGFGAVAAWEAVQARQAAAEDRLRERAQSIASALDREIDRHLGILRGLAAAEALEGPEPDLARFEAQARRVAEAFGTVAVLIDTASRRQVVNTSLPPGASAGAAATQIGDRVLAAGQHLVTDLVTGPVGGRTVIVVAVPVVQAGRTRFLLALRLDPEVFRRVLLAQNLQAGVFASLTDSRSVVVARSDALHVQRFGQPIPEENRRLLAEAASGTYRAAAFDGVPHVFGFRRLGAASGWNVVVAQPAAAFDAPRHAAVRMLATGALVALTIGSLLAAAVARSVLTPVRRLESYARSLAVHGSLPSPAGSAAAMPPVRVAELEALRDGFVAAEAAVAAREATLAERAERLRESETRLRLASEAGGIGFFSCDLATGETHWSDTMYRLYGVAPTEPAPAMDLDGAHMELVHPEDRAGLRAQRSALAADPAAAGFLLEFRIRRRDTGEIRWISGRGEFTRGAEGQALAVRGAQQDVTERRESEDRLHLMVHELNHRVKNTLVTVQAIATQSLRDGDPVLVRKLQARLLALAAAHDVLTREAWAGAGIHEVVAGVLAPHGGAAGGGARFRIAGPAVRLMPRAAVALSMALHELATNAVKYGALSSPSGSIAIRWDVVPGAEPGFRLTWTEEGGPPVAPATQRGFGTRLVERSLAYDIRGTARIIFDRGGVTCRIEAPLAGIAAEAEVVPLPRVGQPRGR